MSDIAIRFDGILLGAALLIGAFTYFVVALIAAIARPATPADGRRSSVACTSFVFGLVYLAGLGALLLYMSHVGPPVAGPDWLDWLTLPTLLAFIAGCVVIARRKPASRL